MSDNFQDPTTNKPFLRALKCAYKLHKAGLSALECRVYLHECVAQIDLGHPLPSASTPIADLLPASFNFDETSLSATYWQPIQDRLVKAPT